MASAAIQLELKCANAPSWPAMRCVARRGISFLLSELSPNPPQLSAFPRIFLVVSRTKFPPGLSLVRYGARRFSIIRQTPPFPALNCPQSRHLYRICAPSAYSLNVSSLTGRFACITKGMGKGRKNVAGGDKLDCYAAITASIATLELQVSTGVRQRQFFEPASWDDKWPLI